MLDSALLTAAEHNALIREEWLELTIRLDERGLYVRLGNDVLAEALQLFDFHPLSSWSYALGACGVAPPPKDAGSWLVANLTMRAGSRLRFADEKVWISLNGQQASAPTRKPSPVAEPSPPNRLLCVVSS